MLSPLEIISGKFPSDITGPSNHVPALTFHGSSLFSRLALTMAKELDCSNQPSIVPRLDLFGGWTFSRVILEYQFIELGFTDKDIVNMKSEELILEYKMWRKETGQ